MLEIIKQSQWFEIVSIILGLYYFYHTRFRGNPAMVSKYVIFVLILDILILPVLIIFCAELVMQFEHNSIVKSIVPNPELARSALLYLAVFWLLARGLDAIVLQKYVLKRTGFSTPLLLRGVCYKL